MKLRYIAMVLFSVAAIVSCQEDELKRFPDFKSGVNARLVLYPDRSFINFDDLGNAAVAFDVYSVNNDIDEIVYEATFTDADSAEAVFPTVDAIVIPGSAFVNGKVTEAQITAAELATLFGFPGGTSYLEGGDKFTFRTVARLKDGREFTADNSAPSITGGGNASFTSGFDIFVGCPSPVETIEGEYYAIMHYNNFGLSIDDTVDVDVEWVGPEPFRYEVTDHTVELYVPFGGDPYPADFYDLCGTAIMQPATSFGTVVNYVTANANFVPPTITINGDDVEFALNWHETNNDIFASVRFVKKN